MEPRNPSRWPTRQFLAALRVPAITAGLLLIPFAVYYIHVRDQREYLTSRNFRSLATMSDQIRFTVDNFQSVMENAYLETTQKRGLKDKNRHEIGLKDFLKSGRLECVSRCQEGAKIGPLSMWVQREGAEGDAWLHLMDGNGAEARIRLKEVIEPFVPPQGDTVFEDVIVADQHEGTVLYQHSRSGLRFTEVNVFLTETAPEATREGSGNARQEKSGKDPDRRPVHIPSKLIETSLSGTNYKVFMQPIQLSLLRQVKGEQSGDDKYGEWVICGFVRADRFLSESLLISYSVLEILAGLLLLAFLSFPFLKLCFMTSRERLRRADAVFLIVSLITAASVTTIFAANSYFSWRLERDQDERLADIAKKIQNDLHDELASLEAQLDTFEMQQTDAEKNRPSEPNGRVQIGVSGAIYPFYGMAYWIKGDGQQVVKWTSDPDSYTPLIDVSHVPIYDAFVNRNERWQIQSNSEYQSNSEFLLYSTFSPNTGVNVAAFMRAQKSTWNKEVRYVGAANRPWSLFKLVLPPGFGYSLITPDGWAVFHSRDERNQRENLFTECEDDAAVLSAAFGGAGVLTSANYLGREHSLYFTPLTTLEKVPLSLVAFRDRLATRTVSLEVLTLALVLFSLYLGALATSVGLAWLIFRPRKRLLAWIWPSHEHAKIYGRLRVAYWSAIVVSAAWLWWFRSNPGALLLGAGLLAAGLVAATVLGVRSGGVSDSPPTKASRWTSAYTQGALGLVLAIGVMPAILFWQASRYFETSLFVSWGQRKLAAAAEARPETNRFEPTGAHQKSFYETAIRRRDGTPPHGDQASIGDCLFSSLTVPYNQVAMEMRGLVGECRSVASAPSQPDALAAAWSWERPPHGTYTLHAPGLDVTTAQFPELRWPQRGSDWLALGATLGVMGLLLAGVFHLIGYSASKIFLLGQSSLFKLADEPAVPDASTKYILALGPVGAGKSAWLDQQKIAQPIHLVTMTDAKQALESARLIPAGEPIAIDHFEYRIDDKKFSEQKLELLEQLAFTDQRPILIVSSVDPRYYLASRAPLLDQGQLARWAGVLDRFSERHFASRAGKHYSAMWTLCSDEEKLMLVHLAQGALANPKGEAALRQLSWKGLIKSEPYRFVDADFEAFVRSTQRRAEVKRWERAGGGWRSMRTGFVTLLGGVALILFVAQRDILQSWIPYMTGVAGWIASMSRVLDGLRGQQAKE